MSILNHDHSSEGFDEAWASHMDPHWSRLYDEQVADQAKWDALTPAEQERITKLHSEHIQSQVNAVVSKLASRRSTKQATKSEQLSATNQLNTFIRS